MNSYSKGGFITITFYKISTLLDILGRSSNFFAPRLSCISGTREIEDSVFLFAVLCGRANGERVARGGRLSYR